MCVHLFCFHLISLSWFQWTFSLIHQWPLTRKTLCEPSPIHCSICFYTFHQKSLSWLPFYLTLCRPKAGQLSNRSLELRAVSSSQSTHKFQRHQARKQKAKSWQLLASCCPGKTYQCTPQRIAKTYLQKTCLVKSCL